MNLLNSLILKKGNEEYIKVPSCKYCRTCNIYLCEDCLKNHQKKKSHELIELYNLKPNYCNMHNKKFAVYCHKCNKNICNDCLKEQCKHNIELIEIINEKKYKNSLEFFIETSEEMKNNKYELI